MKRYLLAGGLAATLTPAFYLRLCHFIFRCGCTWFFAGGSDRCNIHNALPPHCPVCTSGLPGAVVFGGLIFAVIFAGVLLIWPRGMKVES